LFKAAYYSQRSRVFVENFAAKLPTSPQLTMLEHQSSSSRSKNSNLQTNEDKQANPYSKHSSWKKTEHFSDVDIK
jgi:hypothetical protein